MCNCHSYNWEVGEKPEVILSTPAQFGSSKDVCVDACIAHVIKALWCAKIWTINSCCGHGREIPSIIFCENVSQETIERAKRVIASVDDREFKLLAWVLTDVGKGGKDE